MKQAYATERVVGCRRAAARRWKTAVATAHRLDPGVPAHMPGYFADRFALGALRWPLGIVRRHPPGFDVHGALGDRDEVLRRYQRPTEALNGFTAEPRESTRVSDFYAHLLGRWHRFALETALPAAVARLPDASELAWREVFDASVFYPRGPAISGPNFFDRLEASQRESIVRTYGPRSPVDFFCLMQQVHETIHLNQLGEPLLNEIVQASLWSAFLEAENLWVFQRHCDGTSLIRESAVINDHPWLQQAAVASQLDVARAVDGASAPGAYFLCCLWANRFDAGMTDYAGYLSGIGHVLHNRRDPTWIRIAIRRTLTTGFPL